MGEGNGNGKAPALGCGMSVLQKRTTRGAKAICLCMIQPFIISVFQNLGSGCFFRSSPKGDPGITSTNTCGIASRTLSTRTFTFIDGALTKAWFTEFVTMKGASLTRGLLCRWLG